MHDAVILAGARTPIGSFMGALASLTAPQLGAKAIDGAIARGQVDPSEVDEVYMGCVLTGGMGQAPARQAALRAGLPNSVPCTTINKVCGSAMKSIMLAANAVRLGEGETIVAGGMESMSNAPYALPKARAGYRMGNGTLLDLMIHDGLWDPYGDCHMGTCGDDAAAELGIGREALDAYAAESYRRALDAQAAGRFVDEIVPVEISQRKGDPILVAEDEEPKRGDIAKLASLRPAFSKDGVTTAGNASSINDGGAAVIVTTLAAAERRGTKPLGRIVGYTSYAHEPDRFPTAPGFVIEKLPTKHNLTVDDIDLFEVNEAFAVVALAAAGRVNIPLDRLNVNGGAVAIGHPIGMTGARLVLTALMELRRRQARYAIATPCIGGGEATAILLERI